MGRVDLKSNIRLFLRIFSSFGLIQVRFGPDDELEVVKSSAIIIPILLVIYWVNAVVVFCYERPSTDTISLVSNIIQLSLNSVMISVAMIVPIKFMGLARKTIKQIQDLNAALDKINIVLDFGRMRRNFCLIVAFFFSFLLYSTAYDAYVTLKNGMMSLKYWFVTILPSVYMVLLLTQSICTLALTRSFYKRVNKAIASEIPSEAATQEEEEEGITVKGHAQRFGPGVDDCLFTQIFHILGDLNEICQKLESYFGPLFLATFTTIFVVTSVQLYYCYQIIIQGQDEARGYSFWSLIRCLNVVFINVVLVISITALCQAITNQVSPNSE